MWSFFSRNSPKCWFTIIKTIDIIYIQTRNQAKRDRKLLLNRRELRKLQNKIKERGYTIVPELLFVNPQGYAKLTIALAKGKHHYDKRETIKAKDSRRDMERELA